MIISLEQICAMLEIATPTVNARPLHDQEQIIVSFTNRPGVEIALLTPFQQHELRMGTLEIDTVSELMFSIRKLENS